MYNNSLYIVIFLFTISCVAQTGEKYKASNKIDSIQINFESISSTIAYDNCKNLESELIKGDDTYKIVITNSDLVNLFRIDSTELKGVNEKMHFDVNISLYKEGRKETYCLKLSNKNTLSDLEGNVFKLPNSNYVELLNHLIYFNYKQGFIECLGSHCNKNKDDFYFFMNLMRFYSERENNDLKNE